MVETAADAELPAAFERQELSMRWKIPGGMVVGWISVAALGWGTSAWARHTLTVDDDRAQCPNAQFTSIEVAVQAAPPGSRIRVCPGLYPETITVDRPLTLDGAGPSPKVRTGDPETEAVVRVMGTSAEGFFISASDVHLSGFTILGDGATTLGVDVRFSATGTSVERNYVSGHIGGIALSVGGPNRRPSAIDSNRVEDCRFGISVDDNLGPSPDVTESLLSIRRNALARDATGIALTNMRGVRVLRNTITGFTTTGIWVRTSTETEITRNVLSGDGPSDAGIDLRSDEANFMFRNRLEGKGGAGATAGFFLEGSTGDLLAGNRIDGMAGDGILLAAADGNTVMLNQSNDNGRDGIAVQDSSGNDLFLDTMYGNGLYDAFDDARTLNVWAHDRCQTDFPPGTICGGP